MEMSQNDILFGKISEKIKNRMAPSDFEIWENTFSVVKIKGDGNLIVFSYNDEKTYKDFTAKYMNYIYMAVSSVTGHIPSVKFVSAAGKKSSARAKRKTSPAKRAARYKRGIRNIIASVLCFVLAVALALICANYAMNMNFKENFYSLGIDHTYENFRIIQLSDLHGSSYGKNNDKLVHRLSLLEPDIIVMTGDCYDGGSSDALESLVTRLSEIAPVYYIYGNNECEIEFGCDMTLEALDAKFGFDDENRNPEKLRKSDSELKKTLEKAGAKVLFNEYEDIEVKGNKVRIFGTLTSNPSAFWQYAGGKFNEFLYDGDSDTAKIFLCHEPVLIETLEDETWGDLVMCGDTHGGMARLPVVGGLYSRSYGLLPEMKGHMIYGKYETENENIIVTSGLSNKDLLRIANRPEIVIADINKY